MGDWHECTFLVRNDLAGETSKAVTVSSPTWVSPQNLIEVFPHYRAMVRVKERQTDPLMSTRVSIPLR
jgi:hypothetical protein